MTIPVGRPSSTIGMCRKSPTAILWIATAIGSSWRSTTGSGVMKSRTLERIDPLARHLHDGVPVGEDPDQLVVGDDQQAVDLVGLHELDGLVDRRVGWHGEGRRGAEPVEVLTEQLTLERGRLLGHVDTEDVGAAVVADVRAGQVLEPARRARN